jgi:hypothetical protein
MITIHNYPHPSSRSHESTSQGHHQRSLNDTIKSTIRLGIRIRGGRGDCALEGHHDGPPGVGDRSGLDGIGTGDFTGQEACG